MTQENTKAAAPTVVAATAAPAAGGVDAGPGLLLAMAVGRPGDGLLTRDAATIQEYILMMSDQAIGSKDTGEHGGIGAERWRQVGRVVWQAGMDVGVGGEGGS